MKIKRIKFSFIFNVLSIKFHRNTCEKQVRSNIFIVGIKREKAIGDICTTNTQLHTSTSTAPHASRYPCLDIINFLAIPDINCIISGGDSLQDDDN